MQNHPDWRWTGPESSWLPNQNIWNFGFEFAVNIQHTKDRAICQSSPYKVKETNQIKFEKFRSCFVSFSNYKFLLANVWSFSELWYFVYCLSELAFIIEVALSRAERCYLLDRSCTSRQILQREKGTDEKNQEKEKVCNGYIC